jgi:hypothetical protein
MALRLKGSSSGYAEIDAAAVAGDVTLTLPSTTGTINVKDGSGTTNVGTGVNLGNPSANIFTISNTGGERLRIAADGSVSIPGNLNISGVLTYEDVTSVDAIGLSTFRDGLITKDVGITTISSSDINDDTVTAVDVFVYDTSKDSDGGAWRKRTSHTSWYNEEAAAGVRGSRKEFPAVAVIVAETTKLTIYDGDDPDLPLWMAFNLLGSVGSNSNMLPRGGSGTESDITSIACLNGRLAVGLKDVSGIVGEGLAVIDFISELARIHRGSASGYTGAIYNLSISGRNSNGLYSGDYNSLAIVAETCNDVAMTVLPNALVDDTTGLPIPTIAVATDGGVSVIKDDGTVVQKAVTDSVTDVAKVEFTNDGFLLVNRNNYHYFVVTTIEGAESIEHPSGFTHNINYFRNDGTNFPGPLSPDGLVSGYGNQNILKTIKGTDIAVADSYGLNIFNVTRDIPSTDNMVAYITSDYNTGYMHGDVKGAFLSGISTTSMPGSNIITNGDFSNGSTGWTLQSGWTVSSNTATCDGTNSAYISQPNTGEIPANTPITVTVTITAYTSGTIRLGSTGVAPATSYSGTGTHSATFRTRSSATSGVELMSINFVGTIDNVIVTLAEEDRSVNDKGLQVFGTVTKSAVVTGADLVAYSGFSASNYLTSVQTAIDFGSSPNATICFISWINQSTVGEYSYIMSAQDGTSTAPVGMAAHTSTGNFYVYDGTDVQSSSKDIVDGDWHHCVGIIDGTNVVGYVDGNKVINTTTSNPPNLSGIDRFNVGHFRSGTSNLYHNRGSLSLSRVTKSIPSAEQVKKMYEDEKFLFQENAKATLYGSSDAVTALAYDEVTDQLHVGTSSGRSDFQGLRRINNTATAVTTAISAHDTFIIEQ